MVAIDIMKGNQLAETLIYRYIGDHGLRDGEYLPAPEQLAAALDLKLPDIESALDAAFRSGALIPGSTGGWSVKSLQAMPVRRWSSFSHSAALQGKQVKTTLSEVRLRLPRIDQEDPIATGFDKAAHEALDLKDGEPFIVISRVRSLSSAGGNDPRAIHRAYLDPKRFPKNFLDEGVHDFTQESLMQIYHDCGYSIRGRTDSVRARLACPAERSELKIELREPVLDLEQRTIVTAQDSEVPFVLEYLSATYWNLTFEFER
jgi:DNA-binding GntR family transcriptional regulator